MDTVASACIECCKLEDEFLTALQRGLATNIEEFVARHPEHAAALRVAFRQHYEIHFADTPHKFQPPTELTATLALRNKNVQFGRGGQAELHSFFDERLGQEVAVKLPRGDRYFPALASERAAMALRFEREARVVSRLDHPGVAPIFALGICQRPILSPLDEGRREHGSTADGEASATAAEGRESSECLATGETIVDDPWPFYVMRRVDGVTLKERVDAFHRDGGNTRRDDKQFRELLDSFRTACRTIQHAHQRGVIHRDVKPENIKIGDNGATIVLDWGIAKELADLAEPDEPMEVSDDSIASATAMNGSLPFMAPEQAAGNLSQIGQLTDVYGLGATLFYMLTGKAPHERRRREQIANEPAPRANTIIRTLPPELVSICAKATKFEPKNRYASAAALDEAIGSWIAGEKLAEHDYSSRENLQRWLTARISAVVATGTVLGIALAALAIIAFAVASARTVVIAAEQKERKAVEAGKLEVETLLMKNELDRKVDLLIGVSGKESGRTPFDPKGTESWDTRYLDFALSQRPAVRLRMTTGRWGVIAADFHAASRQLAVAHADGEFAIWDVDRHERVRRLVESVWDDEQLLSLHYAMRRRLSDEASAKIDWITGVAWLPNGKQLVTSAMSGKAQVFDPATGQSRALFVSDQPLLNVAVESDGKTAAFGDSTGRVIRRSLAKELSVERRITKNDTTAITCLNWFAPASAWITGDEEGSMQVLDGSTLETLATASTKGPIWSITTVDRGPDSRIAMGGNDGHVQVFGLTDANRALTRLHMLTINSAGRQDLAMHALQFDSTGNRMWGVNKQGELFEWDVPTESVQWTKRELFVDERRVSIESALAGSNPPEMLPIPFRRTASAVIVDRGTTLLTAGDDGMVCEWPVPARGRGLQWGTTEFPRRVGPGARLAFSKVTDEHLFSLDLNGDLNVSNSTTGGTIAKVPKAHVGTAADIAALPDGSVVTAGGDKELRFWRLRETTLIPAREPIGHAQRLISVTTSIDGNWVAAVDEQSGLSIWNVGSGARQHFEQLPTVDPNKPYTGRIAFSYDGHWLAAFGSSQAGCVFECAVDRERLMVRRIGEQLNIAGDRGGTAMIWNPAYSGRILFADDHPRWVFRSFGTESRSEFVPAWNKTTIVDFVVTPDGRRLLAVTKDGSIESCDARHEFAMVTLQSGLSDVAAMAIDRSGRRLVVANQEGTLEVWNTDQEAPKQLPLATAEPNRWQTVDLLPPSSVRTEFSPRSWQSDSRGSTHVLVTESLPNDFHDDGALIMLSVDGTQVVREAITPGGPEHHRRMTAWATALFLHDDQPNVVFRCRTAEMGAYDGQVVVTRRIAPGTWERSLIEPHGNFGFFPVCRTNSQGELTDFLHFSFGGYYMVRSSLSSGIWKSQLVGEAGDGFHQSAWTDGTEVHVITGTNRFNSDHQNSVYFHWSADGKLTRELLPAAVNYLDVINGLPDGRPVVSRVRHQPRTAVDLLVRTNHGWKEHQRLPRDFNIRGECWTIGPDGATYFCQWNSAKHQLELWRGQAESWSGRILATRTEMPLPPTTISVRCNPAGNPIVLAGDLMKPFSWLKLLRERRDHNALNATSANKN